MHGSSHTSIRSGPASGVQSHPGTVSYMTGRQPRALQLAVNASGPSGSTAFGHPARQSSNAMARALIAATARASSFRDSASLRRLKCRALTVGAVAKLLVVYFVACGEAATPRASRYARSHARELGDHFARRTVSVDAVERLST